MDTLTNLIPLLTPVSTKHGLSPTLALEIYKDVKLLLEGAPKPTRYFWVSYTTNKSMFNEGAVPSDKGFFNRKYFIAQVLSQDPELTKVLITAIHEFKSEEDFKEFTRT